MRAQHPGRRITPGHADQPCLLRRQRGLRHLAGPRRPGVEDEHRRHPGVQQRARRLESRARVQHRRGLPAAVGRARRRGRVDPRQPGPEEDRHRHREDRGARRARDPRNGAGRGRRRHRRQLPGRGRFVEPSAHRRRSGRRPPGRDAAAGHGGRILQFRRLHHHHRAVPVHRGLGHHDPGVVGQGRLHPLRRAGLRPCAAQGRPFTRRGALRRTRRLLRAGRRMGQAGGGLRGGALEVQADPRGGPCRRDGRRRRQRSRQGTLVHGGLRRRNDLHARTPRGLPTRRRGDQHCPHPGGADRGDGCQRRPTRLRPAGQPDPEGVDGQRPGHHAARGAGPAAGDGARALRRPASTAGHADRCRDRAPEHEGQVRRVGDGPEDAGHLGARPLGARSRAATAAGQLRLTAGARGRRPERPSDARYRRRRRGQPGRRPGAGGRRRGARRGQFPEHHHGRRGGGHRPEASGARAGLHPCADRPVRRFGPKGRPPRRVRQLAHSARCRHPRAVHGARQRGHRLAPRGHVAGRARPRREVGVHRFPAAAGRPALARRDLGRDLDHHRLGPAGAQAHQPPDRGDAALVPAPVWRDGGLQHPGRAPPMGFACAGSRRPSATESGRWPTCATWR